MSLSVEKIDIWRSLACETQKLDFKEAGNQYDTRKLCRTIANQGGMHQVLVIADNTISLIITAPIEQGLVKSAPNAPDSRRYARYIPAWA